MKSTFVFDGNELKDYPDPIHTQNTRCWLHGKGPAGEAVNVPLDDEMLSRHLLFLGGIGTGKTNAIFQILHQLRNSMTNDDVMVIFDTKGDFYNEFYQPGDIVISNDEKAAGPTGKDYWNLFNEIRSDNHLEETVLEIGRTLFSEKAKLTSQPFFPNAARDLFCACIQHFLQEGNPEILNNQYLHDFFNQSNGLDIRTALQSETDLKANVSYISDDRSPQTQGVLSELHQTIQEIFIGNFHKKGNLSIREAIRQKSRRVIFIEYDLGIGKVLLPIYRLIIDLAIKEALCREKSKGNVWFILDEFRLLPDLEHIDDGVNFGRSLGAKFIIGVQNVEQVFHAYGEEMARSILSGFSTTIAFRVHDNNTRTYIQQLFGRNRKRDVYMATVQSRGVVEEVRDANVVEDWDIDNLHVGQAIISLPEKNPFKFQFERYSNK
jgi:type IV secretory pathway TraG/TraD family ATPase VirD4